MSMPRQNDDSVSTALTIQKVGCEAYSIYLNEHEFMPPILTLGNLLPFGHSAIVGCKVFYGAPRLKDNRWRYACEVFTGQITLVLASHELRDLFWQELQGKRLGNNRFECELKTPNHHIRTEQSRTLSSTRVEEKIWEFYEQFTDDAGHLVDARDYTVEYREARGV